MIPVLGIDSDTKLIAGAWRSTAGVWCYDIFPVSEREAFADMARRAVFDGVRHVYVEDAFLCHGAVRSYGSLKGTIAVVRDRLLSFGVPDDRIRIVQASVWQSAVIGRTGKRLTRNELTPLAKMRAESEYGKPIDDPHVCDAICISCYGSVQETMEMNRASSG